MENYKINAAYVQFGGRVVDDNGNKRHIAAAALYFDKELTRINGLEVCELVNFEENKVDKFDVYKNRIAEYGVALKLIYKYQNALLNAGFNCVVLCTSNGKLYKWLKGERVPGKILPLWETVCKPFRRGGDKQLDISVGLLDELSDKKVYKFCRPVYIDAVLCKLKRGIHIMTAEEVQAAREKAAQQKLQREQENLENGGVSIYDILQPNQQSELEPIVIFDNKDSED